MALVTSKDKVNNKEWPGLSPQGFIFHPDLAT